MTWNVLTLTDENLEQCIFPICQQCSSIFISIQSMLILMFIVVLIYNICEINVFYILKTYDSIIHKKSKEWVNVLLIIVGYDTIPHYLYIELRVKYLMMTLDYWILKRIHDLNIFSIMLKSNDMEYSNYNGSPNSS